MIETDILKALQKAALAAFDTTQLVTLLGWSQDTRIKAIGRTFTAPSDAKYVEFLNIVNNRADDYYAGERVYQGNFRVILHWSMDDEGAYNPTYYLDQFGDYFTKNKVFVSGPAVVKIYQNPSAQGMIPNGSELLFPLSLPYRCFKP